MSDYLFLDYTKKGDKELNQDSFYVDRERNIAIIADGVSNDSHGNSSFGEEASHYAVMFAQRELSGLVDALRLDMVKPDEIENEMRSALEFANERLEDICNERSGLKDIATTMDVCLIYDDIAYVAHVGDSRVYHIPEGTSDINLLTKDHHEETKSTEGLSAMKKGLVEMSFPISNCIGMPKIYIDMAKINMNAGDILFMATDGVSKRLTDDNIYSRIRSNSFDDGLVEQFDRNFARRSDYAKDCAEIRGCSIEEADGKLIDDITYVAVRRMS